MALFSTARPHYRNRRHSGRSTYSDGQFVISIAARFSQTPLISTPVNLQSRQLVRPNLPYLFPSFLFNYVRGLRSISFDPITIASLSSTNMIMIKAFQKVFPTMLTPRAFLKVHVYSHVAKNVSVIAICPSRVGVASLLLITPRPMTRILALLGDLLFCCRVHPVIATSSCSRQWNRLGRLPFQSPQDSLLLSISHVPIWTLRTSPPLMTTPHLRCS